MRVFFCTFLTALNQQICGGAVSRLAATSGGLLRAVPRDTLHITYVFVPSVSDEVIRSGMSAVAARVAELHAFEIVLAKPTLLLTGNDARLLQAPVEAGTRELAQLARTISQALRSATSDLVFKPTSSFHVTLARFRKGTRRANAESVKPALATLPQRLTNQIDEVQLVASELTAAGPKYTTVNSIALA